VIITDKNVRQLYGHLFPVPEVIEIGIGEGVKTLETVEEIYQKFLDLELDRSSFVVGIGGGVVCDITGFCASTYMRGLRFGFVPSTLVAQVDASIGGKNGVNFKGYKNIVGIIRQPQFILVDFTLLKTLPDRDFLCGVSEIIKSALIRNKHLFETLEQEHQELLTAAVAAGAAFVDIEIDAEAGFREDISPFKEGIIPYLSSVDAHAEKIQAVNCLVRENASYAGCNTDSIGALQALKHNGVDPHNKRIVVLGAGGAARAAVYGLIEAFAQRVVLLNRTAERAKNIAQHLGCDYVLLEQAKEILRDCDILISCLPFQKQILDPNYLEPTTVVMDANYHQSSLIHDAEARGCQTIGGIEWLIYQALSSFTIFTKRIPPLHLFEEIKADLGKDNTEGKPNIALVGFMGSGKTEVGRLLADKMGLGFVDTDTSIQENAGMSISEIFKTRGESSFRAMEHAVIRNTIPGSRGQVFSLGGGAVLNPNIAQILKEWCHVVWLWVSSPTIQRRVDISSRPLLDSNLSQSIIEQMLRDRFSVYAQASDLVISNESDNADKTAERIRHEMDQAFRN